MKYEKENKKFAEHFGIMTGGFTQEKMDVMFAILNEIRDLKKEKNAVILSHYYMPPELQVDVEHGGVSDYVGDSLGLSLAATKTNADVIIFCGVKFMAETAYILNPGKLVLIPDMAARCSLAESITGEDVKKLKEKNPGIPVIAYINTYAETKAECDVICTSRNAIPIAQSFQSKKLIFIPDMYMGHNLAARFSKETDKELILWTGTCEVHEQFKDNIENMTLAFPEAEILLHWEVPDRIVRSVLTSHKGIVGSTTDIIQYVGKSSAKQFILGSECDLGATLKGQYPDKEFITPCFLCRYMKLVNLPKTLAALKAVGTAAAELYAVNVPEDIRKRAYVPLKRMLDMSI